MVTVIRQQNFHTPAPEFFDIFAAFEKLETKRKLFLCDQLFHSGNHAFVSMVQKIWPMANETDSMKLERLLRNRIERSLQAR
jgi:hypothetical protein